MRNARPRCGGTMPSLRERFPIQVRIRGERIDRDPIRRLLDRCLHEEGAPGSRLEIVFCGDHLMRRLNHELRGKDRTTDVLSFAWTDGPTLVAPEEAALGEVVISLPTLRRQAKELEVDPGIELVRLLVHGTLHVLGYDHETPPDRARMVPRERRYRRWAEREGVGIGLLARR